MKHNLLAALKFNNFRKVALLLLLCQLSAGLVNPFISLFLSQSIHASNSQIGYYVILNSLFAMFINFFIANISDKLGERKIFIGLAIVSAIIGYMIYVHEKSYMVILLVSISIIGISTTLTSQIFAYAKELFCYDDKSNDYMVSLLRIVVSLAWVGSPIAGAYINNKYNYGGLFLSCSIGYFFAFLILLICFGLKKDDGVKVEQEINKSVEVYEKSAIALYFLVFSFLQSINTVLNTVIPLYVTETLNNSNVFVGYIASFSAIVEIPITIYLVKMSLKVNIKKLIHLGMMGGLIFLIFLIFTKNIYLIIFIHIFKAIFVSSYMALGITFFQNMISKRYGFSTVLYTNTTRMGNIFGGFITSITGKNYIRIFLILSVICIISQVIYSITNLFVRKNSKFI